MARRVGAVCETSASGGASRGGDGGVTGSNSDTGSDDVPDAGPRGGMLLGGAAGVFRATIRTRAGTDGGSGVAGRSRCAPSSSRSTWSTRVAPSGASPGPTGASDRPPGGVWLPAVTADSVIGASARVRVAVSAASRRVGE